MEQSVAEELLEKYRNGSLTSQEKLILEEWYINYANASEPLRDKEVLLRALNKLDSAYPFVAPQKKAVKVLLLKRLFTAAAVILIIGLGCYFYIYPSEGKRTEIVTDIHPGKKTATLTLANGRKIKLSSANSGPLAEESDVSITKSANGQLIYHIRDNSDVNGAVDTAIYNTITTANGEEYQINLSDGTRVWMNAASSIKFDTRFKKLKERRIELSGEAYFEVAKDKNHPFIVQSHNQEIQVLGTHFDVNMYADEPAAKTTLLEGSISLTRPGVDSQKILLKPGQQSAVGTGQPTRVYPVNVETVVDWIDGDFTFKDEDFRTAMRKIARWYNVQIIYESIAPPHIVLGGWLSRKNTLSTVLDRIESTGSVHFRIEGRRVFVTK